jgi:HPt (histidine-containing phosphotransfer) domain-containing protein
MDDYISKPVQPKELKEKLDRWIAPDPKRRISADKPEVPYVAALAEDSGLGEIFLPEELLERLMGDEEVARTIIAGFLSDIPEQIEKFKKCVDAGDSVAAHRLAHTIKGAAGNIGAPALRRVAFELEELGEAVDLDEAVKKLPQLDEEFGSLRQKLMQKGWF